MRGHIAGHSQRLILALLAFVLAIGSQTADAQRRQVPELREALKQSFSPIVKSAAPAVVNVYVQRRVQAFRSPFANDPVFGELFREHFGLPRERMQNSLGSGVIINPAGIVVTNNHVIKGGGDAEIRIVLHDKREFAAKIVSQDEKSDIAVLRIEGTKERFPHLVFANSDELEVGDLVLAIGNPFGVGQTVTSGIVSALSRSQIGRSDAQVFIQTDAAINPGNSGGALIDIDGRLVGINTAIFSRSGGSHGIGFAIPSNLVRLIVEGAISGKPVVRPWLGAKLEVMTRDLAEALGMRRVTGALVQRVRPNTAASEAGLKPGDVITSVDGIEVDDVRALLYRLTTKGVGNTALLGIVREGRQLSAKVWLRAAPRPGKNDFLTVEGVNPFAGARVATLLPALAEELDLDEEDGVVVIGVPRQSIAGNIGLKRGDIIVTVNDKAIASVADLEKAVAARQPVWRIAIKRGGRILEMAIRG